MVRPAAARRATPRDGVDYPHTKRREESGSGVSLAASAHPHAREAPDAGRARHDRAPAPAAMAAATVARLRASPPVA